MFREKGLFGFAVVLVLLLSPFFAGNPGADGVPTREAGEDLLIDVRLEFRDINLISSEISVSINTVYLDDELYSADEIREANEINNNISTLLDEEMDMRAWNAVDSIMSGDQISLADGEVDQESMEVNIENAGEPIIYRTSGTADIPIEDLVPGSWSDKMDQERIDFVFSSLMLGGFIYSEEINVTASEGEMVKVHIPTTFDPFDDGSVEITMNGDLEVVDGYSILEADGRGGNETSTAVINVQFDDAVEPDGLSYSGGITLDWHSISSISVTGDVGITSFETERWSGSEDLPSKLTTPESIPSAVISSLYSEGVIEESDLGDISKAISDELEEEIESSLEDVEAIIEAEIDTGSLPSTPPTEGSDLMEVFSHGHDLEVLFGSVEDIDLNLSEEYTDDEIMGLLNGGISIEHAFDPFDQDDLEVTIRAPEWIILQGEEILDNADGRRLYAYTSGTKTVSSTLAPNYEGENVSLSGEIDLSEVKSHYFSDAEIDVKADLEISLYHMDFDPSSYDFKTDLDYSIDYLNSDLLRLLADLGIIQWSEVEDEAREIILSTLEDLIEPTREELTVELYEDTLAFDDDYYDITGNDPLRMIVGLSSRMEAKDGLEASYRMDDKGFKNAIVPIHFDPVIPVYTVERSLNLGEATGWELDLQIKFPSGVGVRGWLGEGDDHQKVELEKEVVNGYPVIYLKQGDVEGDHLYMEIQFGPYFAGNNVTICFSSIVILILVVFLIFLLAIIKMIRKKKAASGEGDEEEEEDKPGSEEEENWTDLDT